MNRLRIAHVGHLPHPNFSATCAADPALQLVPIAVDLPSEAQMALLASCAAYYVTAARDELPRHLHVTAALLALLPALRMAASMGAGYDTIDVAACTAAGVLAVNQAGGNAQGVAEHAIGMMLACLKRMPEAAAAMRAGQARDREALMGRELRGRRVGLVGCGNVGQRVASILQAAFGCEILATDPFVNATDMAALNITLMPLEKLLARADIVSLHCPLNETTRGLIGAAALALMRPGAILVTTARGAIHDEAAVLAALQSGLLAGAGLDVWQTEPPDPTNPLLHHPKVIATQHTAGVTQESRANITRIAALAFSDFAAGRMPPRVLNPEVLARPGGFEPPA